ncbi:hypothetical protein [Gorillibacterium massiliense]|uniref:hypothetical protein n=1 Tax=Gorillibacterium massiliense TaxID=1280390 RepID=UPI0004BA6DB1|nr:hypothetical protein [Gorillibacterium massiliense]
MRIPQFDRYRGWLVGCGLFLAGTIVGSAVYMSVHQANFSLLAVQNTLLKSRLEEAEKNVASLTKTRSQNATIAIVKVQVAEEGTEKLDDLAANELKKKVLRDLQVAVGKPLSAVKAAPEVFIRLVDGKVYHQVREKDYLVRVRTVFAVQGELSVWITVQPYE